MTKHKHTPGPWRVHKNSHISGEQWLTVLRGAWDITHNSAAKPDAIADAQHSSMSDAENLANARLIAAAPELLEALKTAQGWLDAIEAHGTRPTFDDNPQYLKDMAAIEAAIAKAEGAGK